MSGRTCPTCGSAMPAQAPESLCPRCLMRTGLESPPPAGMRTFVPPTPRELEPAFPQLEIQSLIGRGGMGAVYKAKQIKLDRWVALKILPRHADGDPSFAERFSREARALARMQHPHIVGVHDFGEAGGHYYLVLEYVDGMNLRELMRAGPVPTDQAVRVVQAVADALQYAHLNEIIHRDIKPENVLIDRQGRVKIADFGLARLAGLDPAGLTLTGVSEAMGTPHYMAPEQLERPRDVDARADLYAIGVMFYEMLTGELPLGRFDVPSKRGGADPRLDDVVLKCLERDPDRRYQSAGQILEAIEAIGKQSLPVGEQQQTEEATSDPVTTGVPEAETPENHNEPLIFVAMAAISAAIVAGIIISRSGWIAFGLLAVEQLAASVNWRASRRSLVGVTLVLAAVATSLAIIVVAPGMWWMILCIWFWFGDRTLRYFKPHDPSATKSSIWSAFKTNDKDGLLDYESAVNELMRQGVTPAKAKTLGWLYQALKPFEDEITVTEAADLEGETLATIRESLRLPAEEQLLAVVQLGDDEEKDLLVLGSDGLYFPARRNDSSIAGSMTYQSFAGRKFVNHGRGVFLGDDTIMIVDPDHIACETITRLMESIRQAAERGQSPAAIATQP